MSIAGSPGGVEDAAATLERAGRDFADAADSIASHGRAVTADWVGSASGAAADAIGGLAACTRVGADVVGGVGPVLRVFAAELRAAQSGYGHAAASAASWADAAGAAGADLEAASGMPTDTPQQGAAREAARAAAEAAVTHATDQVSAAQDTMVAAVARAERANQVAADAVDALTEHLSEMSGTARTPTPAPAPPATGDHGHHHGWAYDAFGGFGDGAWKLGPGAVGDLVGLIPTGATHDFADWVDSGHDALEHDYGADTDTLAYRGTSTGTQVAGLLIPGEGFVRTGELAARAEAAAAEGGRLAKGAQEALDPATMDTFLANGASVRHSPTATAIGDDEDTIQNFLRSKNTEGHDVILHGTRDGQPLINGYVTHPQQVAEAVRANSEYTGGPINLVMCHGGRSAADELSQILGVPVRGYDSAVDLDSKTGLVRLWERGPDGVPRQIGGAW